MAGAFSAYSFTLKLAESPRIAEYNEKLHRHRLKPEFVKWLEGQSVKTEVRSLEDNSQVKIMSWEVFDSGLFFVVFLDRDSAALFKTFWM